MTAGASLSFVLQVDDVAGANAQERATTTGQLQAELAHLQLDSIQPLTTASSQLAVVVPSPTLPRLIDFIHAWCGRNHGRSVVIKTHDLAIALPESSVPSTRLAERLRIASERPPRR
ncbi:MAG TPA: hypothetical protein VJV78_38850 [Polyangiales bacterium]|nr:hypothetical protein [Polyangiales bacterium]